MPEGVSPYPRWEGTLAPGRTWGVIAAAEARRAFRNFWSMMALAVTAAIGMARIGNLYQARQLGEEMPTKDELVQMLNELRWGALALAATMGGPALLEDARLGALDLYYCRAVTRLDYLGGKVLSVLGFATLALLLPGMVYWLASYVMFGKHPSGWGSLPLNILLYSLLWGVLVSGVALGVSCVGRSGRGAALIMVGVFASLEIVVGKLLSSITADDRFDILSPFAAMSKISAEIFGMVELEQSLKFELWWAMAEWGLLVLIGWSLVVWKHPRVRGEEPARA